MYTIKIRNFFLFVALIAALASCEKYEYKIPDPISTITNDCIKRSLGPNIASLPIEFVYAVAIPKSQGKISAVEVQASIPGAAGTYLEHRSYYTNASGVDVPVTIGSPSVTTGANSKVVFNVDTIAAALRYYYIVPNEAKGKQVSFNFTVTGSDGKTASYKMGPYDVSNMDIKRNIAVVNNAAAYISIEDMTAYTATAAASNAAKIDLVYLFRTTPTTFAHGFVSPASDPIYLPGVTLPAGVNKSTKLVKVWNLADRNLSNLQFGVYVDDPDFQKIDFTGAPNYAIGMRAEAGMWAETADGKYRAYIFINSINANGSAVISMLRYPMTSK